jgi:hypothetical protein
MARQALSIAVLALVLAFGVAAFAASSDRSILVFVSEPQGTLGRELSAELEAMGFSVELRRSTSDTELELEAAAREARALAAVEIDADEDRLELLIVDAEHGKSISRRIERERGVDRSRSEVAVLRAAELVRVTLITTPPANASEATPATPTPAASAAPSAARESRVARRSRLTGSVGPAVLLTRGLRPGVDAALTGGWQAGGRWFPALYAGARIPLIPAELSTERGAAKVSDIALFFSVAAGFAPENSGWFVELGGGAAFDWLLVGGESATPYVGRRITGHSFSPMVEAGFGLQLSERFRLRTHASLGYALPSTRLVFAGVEEGRWGAPWSSIGLAFETILR